MGAGGGWEVPMPDSFHTSRTRIPSRLLWNDRYILSMSLHNHLDLRVMHPSLLRIRTTITKNMELVRVLPMYAAIYCVAVYAAAAVTAPAAATNFRLQGTVRGPVVCHSSDVVTLDGGMLSRSIRVVLCVVYDCAVCVYMCT